MPIMKMNKDWKEPRNASSRKEMVNTIKTLTIQHHSGESGIVHTANFAIAQWLTKELEGQIPHIIYHHNPESGDDRRSIIEAFQQSKKPGLLISPSITEGLDLFGDLARFAIIVKLSYPNLGDQWIKRRMEMSQEWYLRQTLIDLIQSTGRIVRSETDWGTNYILDSSFTYLQSRTTRLFPSWWKESLQMVY